MWYADEESTLAEKAVAENFDATPLDATDRGGEERIWEDKGEKGSEWGGRIEKSCFKQIKNKLKNRAKNEALSDFGPEAQASLGSPQDWLWMKGENSGEECRAPPMQCNYFAVVARCPMPLGGK